MNTSFSDAQNAQNGNLSLKPLERLNGQVQIPFTVAFSYVRGWIMLL